MDKSINAHEFAITVVSANPQNGTIQEIAEKSLELYKAAYDAAINHNEPIHQKQSEARKKNTKAFIDAFN